MSRCTAALSVAAVLCSLGFVASFSTTLLSSQAAARVLLIRRQGLSQGWDNDNFLESLGKGQEALEEANEEYWKQSEMNEKLMGWKAELQARQKEADEARREANGVGQEGAYAASPEMIAGLEKLQSIAASNEENPTGGTKFQQMMERAKRKQQQTPTNPTPPPATPQPQFSPPQQPQQQPPMQLYDQYGNPVQLPPQPQYFDKDGNPVTLYPPVPSQPEQQQQQQQQYSPPPPVQQRVKQSDGRPVGRNKDADAISNTADVYFAQLKRDSTIRTTARIAGDVETANKPLDHPDIDKMKDLIQKNPYLEAEMAQKKTIEEEKKKIMSFLETSEDEMIDWSETAPTRSDQQQQQQQQQQAPQEEEEQQQQQHRRRADMGNYQSFKDQLRAAQAKRNRG